MLRFSVLITGICLIAAPALAQADDFPWLTERKILGTNDLEGIEATVGTPLYDYARAVARVEVQEDAYPFCTATQVGDGLFLTNWHCDHGCETMQFRLGYEKDRPSTEQRVFHCTALLRRSENLDYALFRAELAPDATTLPTPAPPSTSGDPERAFPVLSLSPAPLINGQSVMVPQHPTGRFKEVDRSADCVISDNVVFHTESGRDTIKHMCDTQGGSSGAPVIDQATGYVVALHWGGLDGQYNEAIPVNLIVDDLKANLSAEDFLDLHVAPTSSLSPEVASSEARSQP